MSDSKVTVTITNRAPGIQPPVYVAGSFSDPEWVPQPMDYTTSDDGVHTFTKTLQVEPGSKIVYKFRAGEGDWWLLNEDAPTVTDDAGNRNNIMEAPKAIILEEPTRSEEPAAEPTHTKLADSNEDPTENTPQDSDTSPKAEELQSVSRVEVLKHSDEADPARSSTPEFIKTITEVSESAALLDRSTPEPEAPETEASQNDEQSLTTIIPNAADIAAEVADSATLLDLPTPERNDELDATGKSKWVLPEGDTEAADTAENLDTEVFGEAPAEVAAQVADTAAILDTEDDKEAPSKAHAQFDDTEANLDTVKPEVPPEALSPAYKTLSDFKVDSLDIAGFSNDPEPVPLFAHECAGLYEDDEVAGASEQDRSPPSSRPYEDDKEDYDDPTLERFPSTRDEIMSTVRKVGTGLNEDQVSVEGIPLSPVVHAGSSPTVEARYEHRASEISPVAHAQQHLPLPPSLTAIDEHSRSTNSLHSIAEDAEGTDSAEDGNAAEPRSEYIADVVEKPNGVEATTEIANKNEAEHTGKSTANEVAPMVEQAETADEVIEVAQEAQGEQSKETGVASADPPAVVGLTPATEDITSAIELPSAIQDIASVIEQNKSADTEPLAKVDEETSQQGEGKDGIPLDGEAVTVNEPAENSKRNDTEASLPVHKPALESVVTVPSPSVKPSTDVLAPVSDDDEAVVVKTTKGDGENIKSGYLTPERAATPQPEEFGSPQEPAPNTADPVAESDLGPSTLKAELETPLPEPRSPQIVVSKPEEAHPDELPLPSVNLEEVLVESSHIDQDGETPEKQEAPAVDVVDQTSREDEVFDDIQASNNVEVPAAPEVPLDTRTADNVKVDQAAVGLKAPSDVNGTGEIELPKREDVPLVSTANGVHEEESEGVENLNDVQTPATTVNGSHEASSHGDNTATTSATENQTSTLKQRSVARPDPADRTGTPISITDSHREAAKGGNWFSAFLRLIFVDFFGGFVKKLYGGGRKTLVTAAVVLVAIGYVSFRRTTQTEEQAVIY